MRVDASDIRRIEIIPETEEEQQVCRDILDGKALMYYGDAGENFTPPEFIGGLIINSHQTPSLALVQADFDKRTGVVLADESEHRSDCGQHNMPAMPNEPCSCGQVDEGQTGEYPCRECRLPTLWDEAQGTTDQN